MTGKYQVLPPLSPFERARLKTSIMEKGILVPVEYDEHGEIIDGHHRVEFAQQLGIADFPKIIRSGLTDQEKRSLARTLNVDRRHLAVDQRRQLIEDELKDKPDRSDRAIGKDLQVDHKTVAAVRDRLRSSGEIPQSEKRVGADGRARRVTSIYVDNTPEGRAATVAAAKEIFAEERQAGAEKRRQLARDLSAKSESLPTGKQYAVIYADPATKFLAGLGPKSAENHYPTMTMEELQALSVGDIALPDSRLYLWTTVPQLANSIRLAEDHWGFTYSSCHAWVKLEDEDDQTIGPGYIFRNQHELLLVCKRGNPPSPLVKPPSVWMEKKREHSRKPDHYLMLIEEMEGDVPRIELFRRVDDEHPARPGWDAWGNQAHG